MHMKQDKRFSHHFLLSLETTLDSINSILEYQLNQNNLSSIFLIFTLEGKRICLGKAGDENQLQPYLKSNLNPSLYSRIDRFEVEEIQFELIQIQVEGELAVRQTESELIKLVKSQILREFELEQSRISHRVSRRTALMLNELNQVSSIKYSTREKLYKSYLEVGMKHFGMEFGIVSRIRDDEYQVAACITPDQSIESDNVFEVKGTYCRRVIEDKSTVFYNHVGKDAELRYHPVYVNMKLESYIGTPIWLNGKIVGTLNFSSKRPRDLPFEKSEISFIEILAQYLGRHLASEAVIEEKASLNRKLEIALDGANLGVWDWDLRNNRIEFDDRFCEMLGLKKSDVEMHLQTWVSHCHPEDMRMCEQAFREYWEGKTPYYEMIHRLRHEDGHWIYVLSRGRFSHWNSRGLPTRFTGTHLDISESEKAKRVLEGQSILLKQMVENIPTSVAMFDREFRYIATSKQWLSDYGLVGQEIIGKSHYDVFPEIGDDWKRVHLRALNGETLQNEKDFFLRADKSFQWIKWDVRPWYLGQEIGGILMLTEDITEEVAAREKLELSEHQLQEAQSIAKVGNWSFDVVSNEIFWSAQMFKMLPHRIEDGVPSLEEHIATIHPDDLETWQDNVNTCISSGEPYSMRFRVRNDEGLYITLLARGKATKDEEGRVIQLNGTCQDISEQVETEEKIKMASRAKSAFLANMSHELRTPLNAIIGFSELIIEEIEDGEAPESMTEDLNKIYVSGKHLLSLINQVLDLSKVESGKQDVCKDEFELEPTIMQVVSMTESLVNKNSNSIQVDLPKGLPLLITDKEKFKQILINLISNSVKFTKEGSISISCELTTEGDNIFLNTRVKDTGIGIESNKLEMIFDEFAQADQSTTRNYGGTGLGLSICRRFCHILGGDIKVVSEVNVGTEFCFTIPVGIRLGDWEKSEERSLFVFDNSSYSKPVSQDINEMKPSGISKNTPILILEDNLTESKLLEKAFNKGGFSQVHMATDGFEGLKLYNKEHPPIVILDLMMPNMNGFEFLNRLEESGSLSNTTVLIFTSMSLSEEQKKSLHTKAKLINQKGNTSISSLVDRVDQLMGYTRKEGAA